MKIVIVAQGLFAGAGGTAFSEAGLCASLSRRGDVSVLCRQSGLDHTFARSEGVRNVRDYRPEEVYAAWRSSRHWLNHFLEGADIVHLNGHWRWEDHFFARLCVRKKIPYVVQPRGMLLLGHRNVAAKRVFNLLLGNWTVRHAARVIALSQFENDRHFRPYRLPSQRVLVLPNGISPVEDQTSSQLPPRWRPYFSDKPFYFYFGRLEARKNLLFLVDVFNDYYQRGGQCALYLMGMAERSYEHLLERKIVQLGLQDRVKLLGPCFDSDRWVIARRSRAVIYPTIEEAFGRVPFEAISAGTLPVVPDKSGAAEYLAPLLPQSIYRHQDRESLLKVLSDLDALTDEARRQNIGRGQEWVKRELNWDRIAERLLETYEAIAQTAHSRRKVG